MEFKATPIEGLLEIQLKAFTDPRGWFTELYKEAPFGEFDQVRFVQDNLSFSRKGVLRGLHLQLPPFDQGKFVTVIKGRVLDVVVDLRKGSSTFGQVYQCTLDGERHNALLIPPGFGHGFSALEDSYFYYKCSNVYNPSSETGIRWDDATLKINWQVSEPILSDKDRSLPTMEDLLRKSVISPN
ncbi:MAG: dTDP-4-dehydrorhamnose 3,5-epimerase [Cyclobacteriaceae bacterium]